MRIALNISLDNIGVSNKNKSKSWLFSFLIKFLSLAICLLLLQTIVFSQKDTTQQDTTQQKPPDSLKTKYDSAINKLFNSIEQYGADEQRKNINEYNEGSLATKQNELIEEIRTLTLEAKVYLESGLDTTGLSTEINNIERWYEITSDGVFINVGTLQSRQNLETSYKIMRELVTRTLARKSALDNYYKNLIGLKNKIDSLYKDSVLYKFSSDSAVLKRYVKKLIVVSQEIKPNDSAIKKTLTTISELQPTLYGLMNTLNTSIDHLDIFQKQLSGKIFNKDAANLGDPVRYRRRLGDIINFSIRKGVLLLVFYTGNEISKLIFLLALIILSTVFLASLKQKLRSQNLLYADMRGQTILKYPVLSSVVIVLNLFQFIFIDPPFIFNALLWSISGICLTMIISHSITRYWMSAWLVLFGFYLLACMENLILQASRQERWIMLTLSIAGIVSGSIILLMGRRRELKEKWIIYFIGFVILLQILSIISNVYGRYNLSKTTLTGGFFNVVLAVLFFWTLRLVNEGLSLASKAYSVPGKKLFNINFDRVGDRASPVFYVLLFVGWFVLLARNFYAFRLIADPINSFFAQERTIGEFSFTIGSIFESFLILYLAGLISRMVSFFATGSPVKHESNGQKGGIGSWLLIIRIAIISIGLLLAFAAVGIPVDRLTIILSALSVGIGFGLQSLVNNLVSGLIISFEKPVNVGDIVEISGQTGTIKSIGFRSSIISTPEGSEVVFPNGVMLNQYLINWTHNNPSRSVDITVTVPYGTNLTKAIQIIKDLPSKDERVLSIPSPSVIVKQFSSKSIELQLSFWVENVREWLEIKSDIILALDNAFKENKMEIPLP